MMFGDAIIPSNLSKLITIRSLYIQVNFLKQTQNRVDIAYWRVGVMGFLLWVLRLIYDQCSYVYNSMLQVTMPTCINLSNGLLPVLNNHNIYPNQVQCIFFNFDYLVLNSLCLQYSKFSICKLKLTSLGLKPTYSMIIMILTWLLITMLLVSPGHQQPWD